MIPLFTGNFKIIHKNSIGKLNPTAANFHEQLPYAIRTTLQHRNYICLLVYFGKYNMQQKWRATWYLTSVLRPNSKSLGPSCRTKTYHRTHHQGNMSVTDQFNKVCCSMQTLDRDSSAYCLCEGMWVKLPELSNSLLLYSRSGYQAMTM